MINWKKVGDHIPTNVSKEHPFETPFVTCIVWVCNPSVIRGGVPDVIIWDTEKKCWHEPDKMKWIYDNEFYQITHFCDERNIPNQ
jgi:hypothetical protein